MVDFKMKDPNGNIKTLSDLKGKVVLLEFWASWCGACRYENPRLIKVYNKYKPKGFEIFAVSIDVDQSNWVKAIEKDSLSWTHVSNLEGQENDAYLIYGVSGIPDNFHINSDGIIVARDVRTKELDQKLNELLK